MRRGAEGIVKWISTGNKPRWGGDGGWACNAWFRPTQSCPVCAVIPARVRGSGLLPGFPLWPESRSGLCWVSADPCWLSILSGRLPRSLAVHLPRFVTRNISSLAEPSPDSSQELLDQSIPADFRNRSINVPEGLATRRHHWIPGILTKKRPKTNRFIIDPGQALLFEEEIL